MKRKIMITAIVEDDRWPDHRIAAAVSGLLQSPPWGLHPTDVTLTVYDLSDPTAGGRQAELFGSGS